MNTHGLPRDQYLALKEAMDRSRIPGVKFKKAKPTLGECVEGLLDLVAALVGLALMYGAAFALFGGY
jgi:hypothetical protein